MFRTLIAATLAVVGLAACSDTTTTPDGGTVDVIPSNATLAVTAPADDGAVTIDSSHQIPVQFTVGSFTLQDPGTCGDNPDCGHVELLVDGHDCDAPRATYNNLSITNEVTALLDQCPAVKGEHNLTVELHHDDGSVVVGPSGQYLSRTVHVTAGSPPPSLAITSPADGELAFLNTDADQSLDIAFTAKDLTLEPSPGSGICDGNASCGVLILNIDGNDCNDPGAPVPINNFGATAGSIAAKLALCPSPTGAHTVTLTVLDDTGAAPIMVEGQPLSVQVQVTTALLPTLAITSPTEGATVTMGGDANKTVAIDFATQNLVLEAYPGAGPCAGNPVCGVLSLNIDGNDCNAPGGGPQANNYGATGSSIDAYLAYCPVPAGPHTVSLILIDDAGVGPLMVNGQPLSASVNITTQ
jgi:hypothetical protein